MFISTVRSKRVLITLLVISGSVLCAGLGLYWWLFADLPSVSTVETRAIHPTTQIVDRKGRVLYEVIDPEAGKQIDLSLANVPQACVHATLATEDRRFFEHFGVDPVAIAPRRLAELERASRSERRQHPDPTAGAQPINVTR